MPKRLIGSMDPSFSPITSQQNQGQQKASKSIKDKQGHEFNYAIIKYPYTNIEVQLK